MNHIFVDFENVQEINLNMPTNVAMSLVLFVGEKQRSLKTDLVEQLLSRAANIQLVRLTSSGKNALDFTLAYHLGRTMAGAPTEYFHVVSKDKGFDVLVEHLKGQGHKIERYNAFADMPFLRSVQTAPGQLGAPRDQVAPARDKLEEFVNNLKLHPAARPKTEKTLRRHLHSHFGSNLTDEQLDVELDKLKKRSGISIDAKGSVSYRLP
ncbi:MAG: hypothetical protein K1X42_00630 [Opitutaceae bacterium]|nr:hypothetical protein [Opitutaceae bacterium]